MHLCVSIGEAYTFRMLDSQTVFDTLHLLLSFGLHDPVLDPPTDAFRARLVCTLLDCCGQCVPRRTRHRSLSVFIGCLFGVSVSAPVFACNPH